jgi:hypothetical protein
LNVLTRGFAVIWFGPNFGGWMKTWQKLALATAAIVLIAGVRVYMVNKAREDPGVAVKKNEPKKLSTDDLAVVTQYYFASFDSAKDRLEGKPVWVKAGYSLPYYPYVGGAVQFSKPQGDLPGAEKLEISKLVKAVAPAKVDDRVPHGSKQYFAVFTVGGPDTIAGTFAAPIGDQEPDKESVLTDLLFYYEDPKTIYDNWPQPVWDAIAKHTPTVGMSENQARMAAGILIESDSTTLGDRTVTYHSGAKTWRVTFAKDVATNVTAG